MSKAHRFSQIKQTNLWKSCFVGLFCVEMSFLFENQIFHRIFFFFLCVITETS